MSTHATQVPSIDREPRPDQASTPMTGVITLVSAMVVIALAIKTGLDVVSGAPRSSIVLPIAIAAGVAISIIALLRFEAFILIVLVARASLDAAKLGSGHGNAPDPSAMLAVLLMVAGALWLIGQRRANGAQPLSMISKAMIAFLVTATLSLISSPMRTLSLLEVARIAAVAFMLVVLERLFRDPARIRHALVAIYLSSIVPMLVAAYQIASGSGLRQIEGIDRVRGTFLHSNPFSLYLTMLIVMGVALYPHLEIRAKLLMVVELAAAGACLLATYTRGAWIATFIGVVVIGILQSRRLLAIVLLGTVAIALVVPSVSARFSDLQNQTRASGAPANSLVWRLGYWTETLPLADRNPVTGIGLNIVEATTEQGKPPHNDFIRAYVETGLLGLAAYCWLLFSFAKVARRSVRRARTGFDRGIAVGFAACVAAFITLSLGANVISQVVVLWYFVAFAAMGIALGGGFAAGPGPGTGRSSHRPGDPLPPAPGRPEATPLARGGAHSVKGTAGPMPQTVPAGRR